MIAANNISLRYGKRVLFEDVNVRFTEGNCYGLIGANGAGKSTFLKILSGELEAQTGRIEITPGERLAVLKQNHFEYDAYPVLETVIIGHKRLYEIMKEKDAIYLKEDFSDADGERAAELEAEFADLNGWNAEAEAAELLSGLGIKEDLHYTLMSELSGKEKVRILLAQALFGNPEILLLDEPTNDLDVDSILWLENYLADFKNTVIVVSHDRHFLDQVCTHIADIDFGKLSLYSGNYTFWYEMSQLALKQRNDQNRKAEEKKKELEDFVRRFSANASKSKQATSRKKLLDKITIDEIQASTRRYPHIHFKPEREIGDQLLEVEGLTYVTPEGNTLLNNLSFKIKPNDKVVVVGSEPLAISALFKILAGELEPTKGTYKWGVTTTQAYLPNDNNSYFTSDLNLVDWLRQYSKEKDESFIRGFLGRMLFSGEEALKKCNVLSGGEKVRCMLSRMMLQGANVQLMDEPTNHLDLEAITALNNGMVEAKGSIFFASHDLQIVNTVANHVIELFPKGCLSKEMTYEEYLSSDLVKQQRAEMLK
ncbi:MAG: hypothetical protein RLZZ175_840 [Bacteroidota bacterium]|jgi:ATPase subunit of ABC transporter with duplicated ATPase domains